MINRRADNKGDLAYMHILFVADADCKYGASYSMKQLIGGILEYGDDIEISVILPFRIDVTNELEDYYRQLGCNVYKIFYEPFYQNVPEQKWKFPVKYFIRGMEYLIGRWTGTFFLRNKIDMKAIDIIHSNSSREDLGAALALKYHKPLIWHIREFGDKDYKCFSLRRNYIGLMNEAAKEFIAVSDAVKEHWIEKGLDGTKVFRIYNGICAQVNVKKAYRETDDSKMKFLMMGSVCETKGQYQLIKACALMTEKEKERIIIDIIGGGTESYLKKIGEMIAKYELTKSVRLLGYQKDAWKTIHSYDCGIMCSKSEGFGRVTVEYMMAGLPVIASDTGANPELIIESENGMLYRWNDIEDLKEKMVYLLNHAAALKQMGENARKYAISHFSAALNSELVYREYLKILEQK